MILSFSTQLNEKPTYFINKIWSGLIDQNIAKNYVDFFNEVPEMQSVGYTAGLSFPPKLHTIREDKTERWKPGVMIDFFVNARKINMCRFAPRIPVISVQEIFMSRRGSMLEITIAKEGSYIGGEDFYVDAVTQGQLATNDGFTEYDDFRNYFLSVIEANGKATGNYWFSGKIIHWTNLKY